MKNLKLFLTVVLSVFLISTAYANDLEETYIDSSWEEADGEVDFEDIDKEADFELLEDDVYAGTQVCTVNLYRYVNPITWDHFYTTDPTEVSGSYKYEGIQCRIFPIPVTGTVALYRYFWDGMYYTDHFYTTNWNELGTGNSNYDYEGIEGYIYPNSGTGRVPLYRYVNSVYGDHFYTTNWNELGSGDDGYKYEGIQGYVMSNHTCVWE